MRYEVKATRTRVEAGSAGFLDQGAAVSIEPPPGDDWHYGGCELNGTSDNLWLTAFWVRNCETLEEWKARRERLGAAAAAQAGR